MKWVEQVAAHGSLVACAVGKAAYLYDRATKLKQFDHPSSVTGLVFDAKGKRVAASHYNGATLWFVGAKVDSPRRLEWKGSHTGIAIHPAGDAVVTSMQENSLHGWRLADGQHMRMSGYPSKTESLGFTRNGKWLATAGADTIVLWPFFGGGPMGKAPSEMAGGDNVVCTRVAPHPQHEVVAAGFADGLVVLADIASERILPVAAPGRGSVVRPGLEPGRRPAGAGNRDWLRRLGRPEQTIGVPHGHDHQWRPAHAEARPGHLAHEGGRVPRGGGAGAVARLSPYRHGGDVWQRGGGRRGVERRAAAPRRHPRHHEGVA